AAVLDAGGAPHAPCSDSCRDTRHTATRMVAPGVVGATTPHQAPGGCNPRIWAALSPRCGANALPGGRPARGGGARPGPAGARTPAVADPGDRAAYLLSARAVTSGGGDSPNITEGEKNHGTMATHYRLSLYSASAL